MSAERIVKYTSQTPGAPRAICCGVLGQELRKARLAAGLSQGRVAAMARISREYLSQLERGVYRPTVEVTMRICAAMKVKAWEIIRRIEEKPRSSK